MKPAPFDYFSPGTVDEALALLAEHGDEAKPLAGGQSLIPAMNFRLARPAVLVDLNGISALAYVRAESGGVAMGAMTRQRTVERSDVVARAAPLLAEAMPSIAHPQIRNRGTVGGSIAHADPSAELPAVMLALEARFQARSATGERSIPAGEFFKGMLETALEPGELLVEIAVPPLPGRSGTAFVEMARRHGDYALVGVAAVVTLDSRGRCKAARLTLLSVGDGPGGAMKLYALSQPPTELPSFWPYYPPFEVKYIKRKAEHGVNAQYIMTSNHMGTHLDAPRHFVTAGKTIDELPLEWLCGPGAIVDLRDEMDELAVYTPQMIEQRVQVKPGDLLLLHTGWHRYADFGATPDEERYYHYHPGAHPDLVPWLLEKKIHVWGVDCVSTDHPMNLPIGRFLGKGAHGQCDKVRAKAEQKFGGKAAVDKMFPDSAYQLTHNALFPKDCIHIENLGGEIEAPELQNKRLIVGCFPWKFKGGEAAFCRTVAFTGEWKI